MPDSINFSRINNAHLYLHICCVHDENKNLILSKNTRMSDIISHSISVYAYMLFYNIMQFSKFYCVQCNFVYRKLNVNSGIDVNVSFNTGWTALMYAAQNAAPDSIDYLLRHGANPNANKGL